MLPPMDDDDLPRKRGPDLGAAGLLARESLDSYSLDELDERIELLQAEIDRIKAHRDKSSAHMQAAEALFRPKPS
jgi:uncharacterized small protein (DUF1192 family)